MTQADEAFALRERRTLREQFEDWLSLARTRREIARRYEEDARKYEASGNRPLYLECKLQAREYRRNAWDALFRARLRYDNLKEIASA